MTNLERMLEETMFTDEEWQAHEKVDKHNSLCDLQYMLENMLDAGEISEEQFRLAHEKAEFIIDKFTRHYEYDNWDGVLLDSIWDTIE